MATANHLTVRDYFDQVLIGKQRTRKVFSLSPDRANASEVGRFHRILTSRQTQGGRSASGKSTGLTIVDYLAHPLDVKSRYRCSAELPSSDAKTERCPGRPDLAATKAAAGKETASSPSASEPGSSERPSAATSAQKKSNSHERHMIKRSIQRAAVKYDLSAGLIKAVIRAESNFQVDAGSRAGAQGLMQLMPATARELGVTKPFDIDQNIDGGARYLRKMLDSFGGDVKMALAAYNSGPGTVRKYAGNVPYPETIQYVDRVLRYQTS